MKNTENENTETMDKALLRPQNRTRVLIAGIAIAALAVWMILADTPAHAEDPGDCEVAYSPEIGRCETPDSLPKPPPIDPDQPDPDSPDPDQPDLPPDSGQRRLGWATATVHDSTTHAAAHRYGFRLARGPACLGMEHREPSMGDRTLQMPLTLSQRA